MTPTLIDQSAHSDQPSHVAHRNSAQASRSNHQFAVPEVNMIFSSVRPQIMDFLRQHTHSVLVPLPGGVNCLLQDSTSSEKEFCLQELNKAIAMAIGNQGGSMLLGFHPHHLNDAYIRQQASLNHRQFMILSKVVSGAIQLFAATAGIKSCKVIIHELTDSVSSHGPIVVSEVVLETYPPRFSRQHHQLQTHSKSSTAAPYQVQPSSSFSSFSNHFPNMLFAPTSSTGLFNGNRTPEIVNYAPSNTQTFIAPISSLLGSKEAGTGVRQLEKGRGILPIEQAMLWSNSSSSIFPREDGFSLESPDLDESMHQLHLGGIFSRSSSQNFSSGSVHSTLDSVVYNADNASMWNAFPDTGLVLPSDSKTLESTW
jgi:hypothetical protein